MKYAAIGLCLYALQVGTPAQAQDAALIAKARQEGTVSLYTISPTQIAQEFGKHFTDKYGIRVVIFRAGGGQIQQKLALEMRSNRVAADVVEIGDPTAINQLASKGGIASYKPPGSETLAPGLLDSHDRWTTISQSVFPIIYNKQMLGADTAPQIYRDLADPKWKDKIVLASPNYGSTQTTLVKGLVELQGWSFIDALEANSIMIARGFPDAENLIATGERSVGIDISSRYVEAIGKGVPLGVVFPADAIVAVQDVMAIMEAAPHPNAARLLVEFYLTAPEQAFVAAGAGAYPVKAASGSPSGLPPLSSLKLHYIDLSDLEAHHSEIVSRWTNTLER